METDLNIVTVNQNRHRLADSYGWWGYFTHKKISEKLMMDS